MRGIGNTYNQIYIIYIQIYIYIYIHMYIYDIIYIYIPIGIDNKLLMFFSGKGI